MFYSKAKQSSTIQQEGIPSVNSGIVANIHSILFNLKRESLVRLLETFCVFSDPNVGAAFIYNPASHNNGINVDSYRPTTGQIQSSGW